MTQKGGIWRFSGVLRVLAIAMAMIYGFYYFLIWGLALAGEFEAAYDFIDLESEISLELWQIICGFLFSGVAIGAMVVIALAASRFLKVSKQDGFFIEAASKACRLMGFGLIGFWAGMLLTENFLPWIMTRNFPIAEQEEIEWFLLDLNYIALLVGVVFMLMSRAMDEARVIDADNKQFI